MAYTPTTWVTGDIITATKLNNIESGVQSVSSSYTPSTWATGDIITAVKLNNIEQGIANAGGGGGGSSDFSTATVTIVNNSSANVALHIPNADDLEGTPFSPASLADAYVEGNSSTDVTAVLYKGQTMMAYSPNFTVTGNASIDMGQIFITGDCTITVS